ncbi:MAG: J domain-containing protein [Polyangiaceae bacterium]|nr:J domain-containing protein [Polyangiaceae bacterium]
MRARTQPRRSSQAEHPPASHALSVRPKGAKSHGAPPTRLHELRREHERLLREIAKKKQSLEATLAAARAAEVELEAKLAPLHANIARSKAEIRAIFEFFCGPKTPLSRKNAAQVRRLYLQMMPPEDELEGADEEDAVWEDDAPSSNRGGKERQPRGHASEDEDYSHRSTARDVASATKPQASTDGLLRGLFRRLAVALHPDKVQAEAEKDERTHLMKEVTRAYESSDIARLLELEQKWLADAPSSVGNEVAKEVEATLAAANRELRQQTRALTAEIKAIKQSTPTMVQVSQRRGRAPVTEADMMLDELQRMAKVLEHIQAFTVDFREGRIPLSTFLRGPAIDPDLLPPEEDTFHEVIEFVVQEMMERGPRRQKRRGRRR